MALKKYRPTTPSTRQLVLIDRSQLFKGRPVKHLTEPQKEFGGRNNTGRNIAIGVGAAVIGGIIASEAARASNSGRGNSCRRWNYQCNQGIGSSCRNLDRYC